MRLSQVGPASRAGPLALDGAARLAAPTDLGLPTETAVKHFDHTFHHHDRSVTHTHEVANGPIHLELQLIAGQLRDADDAIEVCVRLDEFPGIDRTRDLRRVEQP